jgi:hypothetical protein
VDNTRKTGSSPSEHQINTIVNNAWTEAARINPMLLAKLRQDYDFDRLRQMIRDCLAEGLSVQETCKHIVDELLRSASKNDQPHISCDGMKAEPEHRSSTSEA